MIPDAPNGPIPVNPTTLPKPHSILIVRLSAIGDVIHTLPCLHALRRAFPRARIGWLVEELSAPLLRRHPQIDALYVIPKKRWRRHPLQTLLSGEKCRFFENLRGEKWDVAVDFQGLTKSGWAAWRSGAPTRIGYADKDGRELNKLFTNRRVRPSEEARHVIQRNLSLLEPLGVKVPVEMRDAGCVFPDFGEEKKALGPFLESLAGAPGRRYIALYPGAGWATKRWPAAHFASLAQLLARGGEGYPNASQLPMVLISGPKERPLCDEILHGAGLPPDRLRMAPPTSLRELAALLQEAAVAVGGDTGPVHLAAALGAPVVGIYGASDPARNGPWGRNHTVLQAKMPCIPCWKTDCGITARGGSTALECLRAISPEAVAEAVEKTLQQGGGEERGNTPSGASAETG